MPAPQLYTTHDMDIDPFAPDASSVYHPYSFDYMGVGADDSATSRYISMMDLFDDDPRHLGTKRSHRQREAQPQQRDHNRRRCNPSSSSSSSPSRPPSTSTPSTSSLSSHRASSLLSTPAASLLYDIPPLADRRRHARADSQRVANTRCRSSTVSLPLPVPLPLPLPIVPSQPNSNCGVSTTTSSTTTYQHGITPITSSLHGSRHSSSLSSITASAAGHSKHRLVLTPTRQPPAPPAPSPPSPPLPYQYKPRSSPALHRSRSMPSLPPTQPIPPTPSLPSIYTVRIPPSSRSASPSPSATRTRSSSYPPRSSAHPSRPTRPRSSRRHSSSPDLYKQSLITRFTLSPAGQKTLQMGARMAFRLWDTNMELERLVRGSYFEDDDDDDELLVSAQQEKEKADKDEGEVDKDKDRILPASEEDSSLTQTRVAKECVTTPTTASTSSPSSSPATSNSSSTSTPPSPPSSVSSLIGKDLNPSITAAILSEMAVSSSPCIRETKPERGKESCSVATPPSSSTSPKSSKSMIFFSEEEEEWELLDPFMQLPMPRTQSPVRPPSTHAASTPVAMGQGVLCF